MFPLNDFNFVACALATVSAAVGYNISRRRGRSSSKHASSERIGRYGLLNFNFPRRRDSTASARSVSISPTDAEGESDGTASEPPASNCGTPVPAELESFSDQVEDGSLKRKRSATSQAVEVQLHADMPPSKRRRTPPVEEKEGRPVEIQETVAVVKLEETSFELPVSLTEVATDNTVVTVVCQDASTPRPGPGSELRRETVTVIKPPAFSETSMSVSVAARPTTPTPTAADAKTQSPVWSNSPVRPSLPSSPWHTITPVVPVKSSLAFEAFCGKPSAFANSAVLDPQNACIWSTSSSINIGSALGDTSATARSDPLEALTHETSTFKVITGEEDETVENELKGAKVFIKRGQRDFCEGILGNVKLLKRKESGDERILFRREPVWKVTMCVQLRSTVRCSFDEAQGALRVALVERDEETQKEQVVVYALKRGKASRADFAEFAKVVMESACLGEQPRA